MTGETEKDVSGWTVDTLRILHAQAIAYERQVSDERDQRYHERWEAQEKATIRATAVANEFRGSLSDLSTKMATKDEVAAAKVNTDEKFDRVFSELQGIRSRLDVGNPEVAALREVNATRTGFGAGQEITRGMFFAAIASLGTLLGIVVVVANTLAR